VVNLSARSRLVGSDHLKIGLFSLNASQGIAMTRVPERWQAQWNDIKSVAQMADKAGLDFLLPLQRWRGYGGATDPRGACMEAMTHSAALSGVTDQIAIFGTVQVSINHPVWAARAVATLDQVSNGRAGLNIVCGWNERDFAMFGAADVGALHRYDQGEEWTQIFKRLLKGDGPFDYCGQYFNITGAVCAPTPAQPNGPVLMCAGFSPPGRDFAARHTDILFTTISSIDNGRHHVHGLRELADKYGRGESIAFYTPVHVVCRPTDSEAERYYDDYASKNADMGAVDTYIAENSKAGKPALAAAMRQNRKRISGGFGSLGVIGSPQRVADKLVELRRAGFSGVSISFVNFLLELPFFLDTVVPRLQSAGFR
jgi:dimethylsulfone monooxygenase